MPSDWGGLSAYGPIPGQIQGRANPLTDSDPFKRARLQEEYVQRSILLSKAPGAVPRSYERLGSGNPPWIGWTSQKDAQSRPVAFPPFTAENTGTIPDWTSNPNATLAGGRPDMNQVVDYFDRNPLNRGPIGLPFWDSPGADLPSRPDVTSPPGGGTIGWALEW